MAAKSSEFRVPIAPNASTASDPGGLELLTTPQLVVFLRSTFLKSDFEEVSRILNSREESMRAENLRLESRCWTLETEKSFLKARCCEMKEKLKRGDDGFRTKIDELEMMLSEEKVRYALLEGKYGEVNFEMLEARKEADQYQRENQGIMEMMKRVEEAALVMREKEQRGRERIASLLEEIQRKERELTESFVGLKEENRNLGCGKKQAHDEADACKRKYEEMEAGLKEENWNLGCGKKQAQDEADRYQRENREIKEMMKRVEKEGLVMREKEQRGRERIASLLEEIQRKERELKEAFVGLKEENRNLGCGKKQAQDEADAWKRKYEEMEAGLKEENRNLGCSKKQAQDEADAWKRKYKKMEARCLNLAKENRNLNEKIEMMENDDGKQQSDDRSMSRAIDDRRSPCETQHLPGQEKPLFEGFIAISDSDNELDVEAPCLVTRYKGGATCVKGGPISDGSPKKRHTLCSKSEPASDESSKRIHFEHRNVNAVRNNNHSIQEKSLFTSTPRSKHFSKVITSDDEDDLIPIGRLNCKRHSKAIKESNEPTNPSMHQCSGCNDIRDTPTHCRNLFVPLRPCKRAKGLVEGRVPVVSSARILSSDDAKSNLSSRDTKDARIFSEVGKQDATRQQSRV